MPVAPVPAAPRAAGSSAASAPSGAGAAWEAPDPMASRVTSARFVGRSTQLAELATAWRDAEAGRATLAFVAIYRAYLPVPNVPAASPADAVPVPREARRK